MSIFGDIWNALLGAITTLLQFFYGWTHDYGGAIVMLTIAMRIVLIPLTMKQTKSMFEMQRIQPKLKALQEKYKKDKEKLQEETLKFYQENKVNPFGGCLPLLLQMPIFIALFRVLQNAGKNGIKLGNFYFIVPDLTLSPQAVFNLHHLSLILLPYALFVVLFGLSTWLPQQMMSTDPQQKRVGAYMSVFMLWIGWVSPAGVLVYWVTSSAWQVGQQWILMRVYSKEEGA